MLEKTTATYYLLFGNTASLFEEKAVGFAPVQALSPLRGGLTVL